MRFAGVAQLAEQLICNQQVAGSSPIAGSLPVLVTKATWKDADVARAIAADEK